MKNDESLIKESLKHGKYVFQYLSDEIKNNLELAKLA